MGKSKDLLTGDQMDEMKAKARGSQTDCWKQLLTEKQKVTSTVAKMEPLMVKQMAFARVLLKEATKGPPKELGTVVRMGTQTVYSMGAKRVVPRGVWMAQTWEDLLV